MANTSPLIIADFSVATPTNLAARLHNHCEGVVPFDGGELVMDPYPTTFASSTSSSSPDVLPRPSGPPQSFAPPRVATATSARPSQALGFSGDVAATRAYGRYVDGAMPRPTAVERPRATAAPYILAGRRQASRGGPPGPRGPRPDAAGIANYRALEDARGIVDGAEAAVDGLSETVAMLRAALARFQEAP